MTAAALRASGGDWVVRHPVPAGGDPALRLICLPHAGGGAGTFRAWPGAVGDGVEVVVVRMPGRESRIAEPPRRRLTALAAELADALLPLTGRPYAVLGHSLGSLIAFETTRELLRRGAEDPAALVVSALRSPRRAAPPHAVYDLPDDRFVEHLRGLGGMPEEMLRDRGLLELVLPAVRADFELLDTYSYEPAAAVLRCPVLAVRGRDDHTVDRNDLLGWAEHTCAGFRYVEVPGGHFGVHEQPVAVAAAVTDGLHALGVSGTRRP